MKEQQKGNFHFLWNGMMDMTFKTQRDSLFNRSVLKNGMLDYVEKSKYFWKCIIVFWFSLGLKFNSMQFCSCSFAVCSTALLWEIAKCCHLVVEVWLRSHLSSSDGDRSQPLTFRDHWKNSWFPMWQQVERCLLPGASPHLGLMAQQIKSRLFWRFRCLDAFTGHRWGLVCCGGDVQAGAWEVPWVVWDCCSSGGVLLLQGLQPLSCLCSAAASEVCVSHADCKERWEPVVKPVVGGWRLRASLLSAWKGPFRSSWLWPRWGDMADPWVHFHTSPLLYFVFFIIELFGE